MGLSATFLPLLVLCVIGCSGLKCMSCDWSHGYDECDAKGHVRTCMSNQKSCETVARRYGDDVYVRKGCKHQAACESNQIQNFRRSGKSTQCNNDQASSLCTCCCHDDFCNVGTLSCTHNEPETLKDCPPVPQRLPHGEITCKDDNNSGSVCEYTCKDVDYSVWPPGFETNVCLTNGSWSHDPPCCARPCGPYFLADVMTLIHFSGDGASELLRNTLEEGAIFGVIAEDAGKVSAMYYSGEPVESSIVKFNEYGTNATFLLELLLERVTLANEGPVNTGKAIRYAMENLLKPEAGMRDDRVPKSIDLYLNINPEDDAIAAGEEARRRGFEIFIFAFEFGNTKLDRQQLWDIAGERKRVFIIDSHFNQEILAEIDTTFCMDPCDHVMHDHEL